MSFFCRGKKLSASLSVQAFFCLCISIGSAVAQTAPVNGLHDNNPRVAAIVNARLVVAPGRVLEEATLLVRDGIIEKAGRKVKIPPDAVKRNMEGKTVYPGFIDLFSHYGIPESGEKAAEARRGARHWNPAVLPERRAADLLCPDEKAAGAYRRWGFTAVVSCPREGIFRGSGALVLLSDKKAGRTVVASDAAQALSFDKGPGFVRRGVEGYPATLMSHLALIRQTLLDARWYENAWNVYEKNPTGQEAPETNISLAALKDYARGARPLILESSYELDFLRAAALAEEFGLEIWVVGTGKGYRRLEELKNSGLKLILPLEFPEAPNVSSPAAELEISLRELRHWDFAPENPARIAEAGIKFALTAGKNDNPEDFFKNLRRAVRRGLDKNTALAALTVTPAKWLGVSRLMGTLEKGKLANFIVTDGDIFNKKTRTLETWVEGIRYETTPTPLVDVRGTWELNVRIGENELAGKLEVKGSAQSPKANVTLQGYKPGPAKTTLEKRLINLSFPLDSLGIKGTARLSGAAEGDTLRGRGIWGDGEPVSWLARLTESFAEKADTAEKKEEQPSELKLVFPEGAFGREKPPEQPAEILVRGATVWTSGPQGMIENADLLVRNGKITAVGQKIEAAGNALVVEAAGKHVTPGLIDAHSHLAIIGGVSEGTQAITPEVRIKDVINCNRMDIYRQLAGGLTTSLMLYGSTNPIGGQNATIKLRWGEPPEGLFCGDGFRTLKLALGENVTQANAGQRQVRYPGSRMGVEQLFRDWFATAGDYRRRWEIYRQKSKKYPDIVPPRKNLRLEALLDVLDGKMQVQCHSYRQDGILAMMRVADDLGFKIGVLIHALEGYKVAEAIRRHGAMPTVFTDWWAYKFEAYDAIPYNGALLHEQGLVVSFNSDNGELGRRMNLEAAKAVKYGGVPPEEALKFVTLNSAKQLGLDHRIGSLEPGKDADFVIWSGNPLSTFTICEETWIEGRKYFSIEEDLELRRKAREQRTALVQKILKSAKEE